MASIRNVETAHVTSPPTGSDERVVLMASEKKRIVREEEKKRIKEMAASVL